MKKVMSILLSSVLIAGVFVGCSKAKDSTNEKLGVVDTIKKNGKVKIGVFSDKPPFGYVDEKGENKGFDVEIAKRFSKDLLGDESKAELVLVEAANRVEYLQSNKVDIILANFTVTEERKQRVDYANPYMKVDVGIVSPEGAPIKSIDELKGKKLIVNKGTTAENFFAKNYPNIELLKFDQNTEAFEALKDKRGVALAHDNTLILAWAKENKGFTVGVTSVGDQSTIAPAVKKGNSELLEWINKELETLGKEDFIKKAYDKTLLPAYGDNVKAEDIIIQSNR